MLSLNLEGQFESLHGHRGPGLQQLTNRAGSFRQLPISSRTGGSSSALGGCTPVSMSVSFMLRFLGSGYRMLCSPSNWTTCLPTMTARWVDIAASCTIIAPQGPIITPHGLRSTPKAHKASKTPCTAPGMCKLQGRVVSRMHTGPQCQGLQGLQGSPCAAPCTCCSAWRRRAVASQSGGPQGPAAACRSA